jgi:hypothetical protein
MGLVVNEDLKFRSMTSLNIARIAYCEGMHTVLMEYIAENP